MSFTGLFDVSETERHSSELLWLKVRVFLELTPKVVSSTGQLSASLPSCSLDGVFIGKRIESYPFN